MNQPKIFLTSDWHFNHNKDFIWKERGFSSVQEMNHAIVQRHNRIVSKNDIVYFLGDAIMGSNLEDGLNLISKLNGQKYLAIGNHDTDARLKAFKEHNIFKDIQMGYRLKYKGKIYILTHYPTITANGSNLSVINLFGHTHQTNTFFENENGQQFPYMYNVGMDAHNCEPISLDDIVSEISKEKEKK